MARQVKERTKLYKVDIDNDGVKVKGSVEYKLFKNSERLLYIADLTRDLDINKLQDSKENESAEVEIDMSHIKEAAKLYNLAMDRIVNVNIKVGKNVFKDPDDLEYENWGNAVLSGVGSELLNGVKQEKKS